MSISPEVMASINDAGIVYATTAAVSFFVAALIKLIIWTVQRYNRGGKTE